MQGDLEEFDALDDYFPSDRNQRMETFYRRVRRESGWLMDGDGKPEGGQWNYDVENRKALPKGISPPLPLLFENDVSDVLDRIDRHAIPTVGRIDGGLDLLDRILSDIERVVDRGDATSRRELDLRCAVSQILAHALQHLRHAVGQAEHLPGDGLHAALAKARRVEVAGRGH